jgi:hypothetical protein
MTKETDRKELQRWLAQVTRLSLAALDPLTQQRLIDLVRDIEDELRKPE